VAPRIVRALHAGRPSIGFIDLGVDANFDVAEGEFAARLMRTCDGQRTIAEAAVESLTWSRDPQVGPWLCAWVEKRVPLRRRAHWRPRPIATSSAQ